MTSLFLQLVHFSESNPDIATRINYEAGSLIELVSEDQPGLFLCGSGSIRCIDNFKTFGSLTLEILQAPLIVGLSGFSGHTSLEYLRANSHVDGFFIPFCSIPPNLLNKLCEHWSKTLLPCEYPLIRQNLQIAKTEHQLNSPLIDLLPREWPSLLGSYHPISCSKAVFLDRPQLGFIYGSIYPTVLLEEAFGQGSMPRLLPTLATDLPASSTPPLSSVDVVAPALESASSSAKGNSEYLQSEDKAHCRDDYLEQNSKTFLPSDYGFNLIHANDLPTSLRACLQMLSSHLNLPTRKDILNRFVDSVDFESADIDKLNNRVLLLLDSLGLSVTLVKTPDSLPLRIPTPSLYLSANRRASLLVSASHNTLHVIDPIDGVRILSGADALNHFHPATRLIRVGIGIHTPQQRFSYSWFLPYLSQYRLQLLEVVSASFLTQMFALATPLLFQQLIDRVVSKGAADSLMPLVSLMLIFLVMEIAFSSLRTFQFTDISNRIDIGIGSTIISRLLRINGRFFDRRPVGELAGRLQEIDNIRRFLTGTALTAVLDACFALIYFVVMFVYSPILSFIVALSVPLLFVSTVGLTPLTQRLIRQRAEASSRTQSFLVEMIGGIQTIKLQSAELLAKRQWEQRHLRSIDLGFKAIMANTASNSFVQFISKLTNILIIGIGSWQVLENHLTIGELIAFRIISGYVTQPLLRLASIWQNFQELSLSFDRVADVVNQPLENGEPSDGMISLPSLVGSIEFSRVTYSYSATSPDSLTGLSLTILPGSFVGLVGQSGCGKSTLLKLVPRFYTPSSGRVLVDGIDISKVDVYSLRSQLGYVPQDCMLFEGTVYSNILMGDPDASNEDVIAVAKLACAHDFIMDLKQGYNTPIGERGAGVSGGQRQRISLARMFLSKPRLIILDEATSALDADTERQVVQNIREHFVNETVLMITHRLSTLQRSDQIVVMHSGVIDSIGSHEELMQLKGRYYALYQSQFAS